MNLSGVSDQRTQTDMANRVRPDSTAGNQKQTDGKEQIVAGQTMNGKVLSQKDGEVTLLVNGERFQAKMAADCTLKNGQSLLFSVKIGSDGQVVLTPLYENTSNTETIEQALEMAKLPMTEETVRMVEHMMQQGQSVKKEQLLTMFQDLRQVGFSYLDEAIGLTRLQLPVTEENCIQYGNYENLRHSIVMGMEELLHSLTEQMVDLVSNGKVSEAMLFHKTVMDLFFTGQLLPNEENSQEMNQTVLQAGEQGNQLQVENDMLQTAQAQETVSTETLPEDLLLSDAAMQNGKDHISIPQSEMTQTFQMIQEDHKNSTSKAGTMEMKAEFPEAKNGSLGLDASVRSKEEIPAQQLNQAFDGEKMLSQLLSKEEQLELVGFLKELGITVVPEKCTDARLMDMIGQTIGKNADDTLSKLFLSKSYGKLLDLALTRQLTLTPQQVAKQEDIRSLYQKLYGVTERFAKVLAELPQNARSEFSQQVFTMRQNLDFMNQLNHMQTYLQLPLKMNGKRENGDLYVYTNKKSLAKKDGNVSALLHLDMQFLGALDVMISMQNQKVSSRFYLSDDESMDLVEQNLPGLIERLEKRGYHSKCEVLLKERMEDEVPEKSLMGMLLKNNIKMSGNTLKGFDVKA